MRDWGLGIARPYDRTVGRGILGTKKLQIRTRGFDLSLRPNPQYSNPHSLVGQRLHQLIHRFILPRRDVKLKEPLADAYEYKSLLA